MTDQISESYEFDVAVSFAGEDREYVEEVVELLKRSGTTVFYDNDYQTEMWGENLIEYFDHVYRVKARYAIIFVSRFYAEKMWTRHERRSALARALEESGPYVLPVRLDDTVLEGLLPTVGYLDTRRVGLDGVVESAVAKLAGGGSAQVTSVDRVPRTEIERQQLLLQRPGGWEYLLFAAQLLRERDAIEERFLDHEMRYFPRTSEFVMPEDTLDFFIKANQDVGHLADDLNRVMSAEVQERAFGAPGEPGDPDRLIHLAHRWNTLYEAFIDWEARLLGARIPSGYEKAADLLARFSEDPIRTYRRFVADIVSWADGIPEAIRSGTPAKIEMTLVLRIPDDVLGAFKAELQRLRTQPLP